MDIFEKLKAGEEVDMTSEEYRPVIEELNFGFRQSQKINLEPDTSMANLRPLYEELFHGNYPATTNLMAPVHIDIPKQVKLGEGVFANHGLVCMAAGGITIGDGTQIAPEVMITTVNHSQEDHNVLKCKGVTIGKNVWIGARALILPGVNIGDNAIVGGGAIVTKDVAPNTAVAGNPAKVIKEMEPPKEGGGTSLSDAASLL